MEVLTCGLRERGRDVFASSGCYLSKKGYVYKRRSHLCTSWGEDWAGRPESGQVRVGVSQTSTVPRALGSERPEVLQVKARNRWLFPPLQEEAAVAAKWVFQRKPRQMQPLKLLPSFLFLSPNKNHEAQETGRTRLFLGCLSVLRGESNPTAAPCLPPRCPVPQPTRSPVGTAENHFRGQTPAQRLV